MATVFLNWREAGEGDLPSLCVSCGAPATHTSTRKIGVSRNYLFSTHTRYATVRLPVCPKHLQQSWSYYSRVVAKEMSDDGILLAHVSQDFVDGLFDYRQRPRGHSRQAEFEEEEPREHAPPRRRLQEYEPNPLAWAGGLVKLFFLMLLIPLVCSGILMVIMLFVLRWM